MKAPLVLGVLAVVLGGCSMLPVREVKVPLPVPCLDQPLELAQVPLATVSRAQAQALAEAGSWASLADQVAASYIILAAERRRLKVAMDGCSEIGLATSSATSLTPTPK